MKNFIRALRRILILSLGPMILASGAWATAWAENSGVEADVSPTARVRNYASLPALTAMVGDDAIKQLRGFFDPAPVSVEPFVVLNEFSARGKISQLGVTLADQMAAVIGNEALVDWGSLAMGEHKQRVSGILQEMDGCLRIHIAAVNTRGERRAYLVNVEMSEPIYRALHAYLSHP